MAFLPDAVLEGTQKGELWEYGAFPPCAVQPSLGFGQVWTHHPELQELSGCPLGPEQPVTVQRRHVAESSSTYDLYWTLAPNAPCFRVSDDGQGGLSGGVFDPSLAVKLGQSPPQGCSGTGETSSTGSLLSFANGQSWLYVSDSPGHGFVVTTFPDGPVVRI
jgi:hypothetical protein